MKLIKRLFLSNMIVVLVMALMPVFLITNDISIVENLIDFIEKPD